MIAEMNTIIFSENGPICLQFLILDKVEQGYDDSWPVFVSEEYAAALYEYEAQKHPHLKNKAV